jgi:F-type H+-transporting ATPase subunit epsilon
MAIPPIPSQLTLEIVAPDQALAHAEVDEIVLPAAHGALGVLPGHTPALVELQVGELWFRRGAEKTYLAVAFGVAEILPDRVIVLARVAERAEDIDIARAESARKRAESRLTRKTPPGEIDLERARMAMLRSMVRLQVATRARTRA